MASPNPPAQRYEQAPPPAGTPPVIDLLGAPPRSRDETALAFDRILQEDNRPVPPADPSSQPQPQPPNVAPQLQPPAETQPPPPQDPPTLRLGPPSEPAPAEPAPFDDASYPDPFALDEAPPTGEPQQGDEPGIEVAPDGTIRNLSQLATAFGVEEPELLNSLHVQTADGNDVPLSSVISGYLAQPEAEQAAQARATLESENETYRTELRATQEEALLRVGHMAKALHQQMVGSLPSPEEMARIRMEDEGRYNEIRIAHYEREQALGASLRQLEEEAQQITKARDGERSDWLKRQGEQIVDIFPDLKNPATKTQQESAIRSYLGGVGFSGKEIETLEDSRYYRILRDALYGSHVRKRATANIAAARDRGLPAPLPAASGRPEQAGQTQLEAQRLDSLREKHRESGSVESAAAIFAEMGVR